MSSTPSIQFVDNNKFLPASVFSARPDRAWCTMFNQDAKMDMSATTMKTCEFGTAAMSQCGPWTDTCNPFANAAKILNSRGPCLWLMSSDDNAKESSKVDGEHSAIQCMKRGLATNQSNILSLEKPLETLKSFPTPYTPGAFNPHDLSTYYAIAFSPYIDVSIEHFANITRQYSPPRILMMDEGIVGPVFRVSNYKHLTRLVMNGTAAADQNPPYVIIEKKYSPELAGFLRKKFPNDSRLVLKHIAASRGEGVVILEATTVELLDQQLKRFLGKAKEFEQMRPFSICIIESFVSAPEEPAKPDSPETIVRIVNLVFQDKNKIEFYPVAAIRGFENQKAQMEAGKKGMVKLGKFNDGRRAIVSQEQLDGIRKNHFAAIAAFTERAISYHSESALEFFLSSDNHILNLVGLELFSPILTAKYREKVRIEEMKADYERLSDKQCDLILALLERNKSTIVRERILMNILLPEIKTMFANTAFNAATNLHILLKKVVKASNDPSCRSLCVQALLSNYMNISIGFHFLESAFQFGRTGIALMEEFSEISHRIRVRSPLILARIHPKSMTIQLGVDYLEAAKKLDLAKMPPNIMGKMIQNCGQSQPRFQFDMYRLLFRFKLEEGTFQNGWTEQDWKEFESIFKLMKTPEEMYPYIWLLPDAINAGWKPSWMIEIIKMYLEKNPQAMFPYFGSIIRFFAQLHEVNPGVGHKFMKKTVEFPLSHEPLLYLLQFLQVGTLLGNQNINELLTHMTDFFDQNLKQHGPEKDLFYNIVLRLSGKDP